MWEEEGDGGTEDRPEGEEGGSSVERYAVKLKQPSSACQKLITRMDTFSRNETFAQYIFT